MNESLLELLHDLCLVYIPSWGDPTICLKKGFFRVGNRISRISYLEESRFVFNCNLDWRIRLFLLWITSNLLCVDSLWSNNVIICQDNASNSLCVDFGSQSQFLAHSWGNLDDTLLEWKRCTSMRMAEPSYLWHCSHTKLTWTNFSHFVLSIITHS